MNKIYFSTNNINIFLVKDVLKMKTLNIIALTLVIIGALNWGLIGIMDFNLVDLIFGIGSIWSRTIYVLVGLAGLYCLSFYGYLNNTKDQ